MGSTNSSPCTAAGFNSPPRHSLCAHPARLSSDIWGSRGSITLPMLSLLHVSPTALPKQGDVALLPHMLLLHRGHSGSCTGPCTGQLKGCSALTQPVLWISSGSHLDPCPQTPHSRLPCPWRQGTKCITSPRHCRQNYIYFYSSTLVVHQICSCRLLAFRAMPQR